MAERRIGLIMNGVTGRMGMNQHLIRSIAAIRKDGGVPLANGDRVMPDPILVGRNRDKLEALAKRGLLLSWYFQRARYTSRNMAEAPVKTVGFEMPTKHP